MAFRCCKIGSKKAEQDRKSSERYCRLSLGIIVLEEKIEAGRLHSFAIGSSNLSQHHIAHALYKGIFPFHTFPHNMFNIAGILAFAAHSPLAESLAFGTWIPHTPCAVESCSALVRTSLSSILGLVLWAMGASAPAV